jgi:hypothetical protein
MKRFCLLACLICLPISTQAQEKTAPTILSITPSAPSFRANTAPAPQNLRITVNPSVPQGFKLQTPTLDDSKKLAVAPTVKKIKAKNKKKKLAKTKIAKPKKIKTIKPKLKKKKIRQK